MFVMVRCCFYIIVCLKNQLHIGGHSVVQGGTPSFDNSHPMPITCLYLCGCCQCHLIHVYNMPWVSASPSPQWCYPYTLLYLCNVVGCIISDCTGVFFSFNPTHSHPGHAVSVLDSTYHMWVHPLVLFVHPFQLFCLPANDNKSLLSPLRKYLGTSSKLPSVSEVMWGIQRRWRKGHYLPQCLDSLTCHGFSYLTCWFNCIKGQGVTLYVTPYQNSDLFLYTRFQGLGLIPPCSIFVCKALSYFLSHSCSQSNLHPFDLFLGLCISDPDLAPCLPCSTLTINSLTLSRTYSSPPPCYAYFPAPFSVVIKSEPPM